MKDATANLCTECSSTVNGVYIPVYHPATRPHGTISAQCKLCGGTLCPACSDDHNWPAV